MCLAVPMAVVSRDGFTAQCEAKGIGRSVSLFLLQHEEFATGDHVLVPVGYAILLDNEEAGFDALIAPGHVATVMGPEEWAFVATTHRIPAAVAGFEADSILAALLSVLRLRLEGRVFLDSCYSGVAHLAAIRQRRGCLPRCST